VTSEVPKWMQRWEKQRSMGKARYILQIGVLGYGLAMFIAMTFFVSRPPTFTAGVIAFHALMWAVGGALFGVLTWAYTEWRYQRFLRQRATSR
jgi:hypothetical protein